MLVGPMADEKESKRPDAPPTSRLGRLARLTALAPRALPLASAAVRRALGGNAEPTDEERRKLAESAKKTAQAMLKTLGEMKGLPLKLGQMASYIDGLAPPGYEEKFKETLKKLQAKAPPLSPEAAIKVVTEDLGAPPSEIFAEWSEQPFAAASIGQVHRAVWRDGRDVAVKVQYPGVREALVADVRAVSVLTRAAALLAPGLALPPLVAELRDRLLEELDYEHEAASQRRFALAYAGDQQIVVPDVVAATRRVLVQDWASRPSGATSCSSSPDRSGPGCSTPTRTRATSGSPVTAGSACSTSARPCGCRAGCRRRSAGFCRRCCPATTRPCSPGCVRMVSSPKGQRPTSAS